MRAAFFTLGCKVNQYETSAMQRQFSAAGFTIVSWEDSADVYVVNSCTVTAAGDKKSRQMLRRARRQNPSAVVALCGCFPQAFPEQAKTIPEADIVLGSKNRGELLAAVQDQLSDQHKLRLVRIVAHEVGDPFESLDTGSGSSRTRAFVKIQDGCERNCAYCIIPKARGPLRSKPMSILEKELSDIAVAGYKEVVLVGINLSCYGADFGLRLLDAVRLTCGTNGINRVRLGSIEPELLTDADIAALSELPELCPQFHLSLQSGCDETLSRMRRHYDTSTYSRIVNDLRRYFPDCAITTDVMVGFPGETQWEFDQSIKFVAEMEFAKVHVFSYSVREGTPAAEMPDQVAPEHKAQRSKLMTATDNVGAENFCKNMLGKTVQVLFQMQIAPNVWQGYSENYTLVQVKNIENLARTVQTVSITGWDKTHCIGEVLPA